MAIKNASQPLDGNKHSWPQIYAIVSVSLGAFTSSAFFGWCSPSIPLLISNSSHISGVTLEDASYFSVIPPISTIVAVPFISVLMDIVGRKKLIMFMAIPQIFAWIFVITAKNLTFIYISRILCGISDSIFLCTIPTYIGEITTPKVRGTWGNLLIISIYFAKFLINIIGSYYDVITTAVIFICFPVVHFILVAFIPESPYYLLTKYKIKEAEKSLQLLRWSNNVQEELTSLTKDVNRQISESSLLQDVFLIKVNRRALFICVILRVSQHFSGLSAFSVYIQYIFSLAGGDLSASSCAVIYTGTSLVMVSIYSFVVDTFGRRFMMIFSSIGCTLALFIEAVYFYILFETPINLSNISWIPLVGMLWYVVSSTSGLGLLPHLITGELFSASIKSKAVGVVNIIASFAILVTPKVFQELSANVGMYLPFFVFGICTFMTTLFCYYCVPETKQKSLEEIQQILTKSKLYKRNVANA